MNKEPYVLPKFENEQEVLLYSINKVIEQGKQSSDISGMCQYRTGCLKCAVGWLIDDEHYIRSIEGSGLNRWVMDKVKSSTNDKVNFKYLDVLQNCHDFSESDTFVEEFKIKINNRVNIGELPEYCRQEV